MPARYALPALFLVLTIGPGDARGQTTPSTPEQQQQQEPQQTQPSPSPTTPPAQAPTQTPLQQYLLQQPGGPPATPAMPPTTTIPPWTPPLPPPPSQTNIPAPLPAPGGPGFVGVPALTLPGAFRPNVTTFRGAALEFHPTLRLSEEYSDNFFQTTSRTEDNFRTTLAPGFIVLLNGARTFGTVATSVDLVHDTAPDSGDDPKVFPNLNASVQYAFTPRLSLTVTENFNRNDSAAGADELGIRRGRQTYIRNDLGVAVNWLLDRIATQAYYRNVLFFNEEEEETTAAGGLANRGDTITHILGLNGATRIATDYLVRAGYEFAKTDTTGGVQTAEDTTTHTVFGSAARQFGLYTSGGLSSSFSYQTEDNTKVYNASLFGAYGLPTGLSLAAAVGYSILTSDTEDTEGTVSADVNVSYRFTRAVISVGAFQDFRQTGQRGQNFGTVETRTYYGRFLYQFTPFISTALDVRYSENEPTGTGNLENDETQKTLTYGAALNWQALRWLTASLRYAYEQQTGNAFNQGGGFGSGDFAENRVTLNLFATF